MISIRAQHGKHIVSFAVGETMNLSDFINTVIFRINHHYGLKLKSMDGIKVEVLRESRD